MLTQPSRRIMSKADKTRQYSEAPNSKLGGSDTKILVRNRYFLTIRH